MGRTLFDKIWDEHVVADLGNEVALMQVDLHLMHDLGGGPGFRMLAEKGYRVRNPELTFATADHAVSSAPGRTEDTNPVGGRLLRMLRAASAANGIRMFDLGSDGQGIVHVIGPEMGLSLPGMTIVCGDSHTCTHGGVGALAFGIGSTELVHVLATQTLVQRRPRRMRVTMDGAPAAGVTPKDMILHLIGLVGAAAGSGFAVEYAGAAIRALGVEGRLTICNLSIELGAKIGMVAPDDATFEYIAGRPMAPKGEMWERALAHWRNLNSDGDAEFEREVRFDSGALAPQVTWGTSPEHVIAIDGRVPDPDGAIDAGRRASMRAALEYMDLKPGARLEGLPIERVFIGSCTNSRLSDLRAAARVAKGAKVASRVRAWVVPGSTGVKRAAEAEGLDRIFRDAGFEWREPGCSLCVGANGEMVDPGKRCVSTSNRNFVGRQGPGARTHLASPVSAAAAALAGCLVDVRKLGVEPWKNS
jgi:3-isopropylmalate/(R)-2-methylmalate dehydratase large subunit